MISPQTAGYTWKVIFEKYSAITGLWVSVYFYTTDCAINLHIDALSQNKSVRNVAPIQLKNIS